MKIIDDLTKINYESRGNNPIKYIVIHYTGNNGDTAANNCAYFRDVNRNASAHYFVDENSVYRCVPDKYAAWSVGSRTYVHPECRNLNSINIEICSRVDSSGRYYFLSKSVDNAVELTRLLMAQYNIGVENVLRHYDVNGKICPAPFIDDQEWKKFKNRLVTTAYMVAGKVSINGVYMDSIMKDGYNYVKIRDICDLLDRDVTYNPNDKSITI